MGQVTPWLMVLFMVAMTATAVLWVTVVVFLLAIVLSDWNEDRA